MTPKESLLAAAAESLSPAQYEAFLLLDEGDTLERLYSAVMKRPPEGQVVTRYIAGAEMMQIPWVETRLGARGSRE